MKYTEEQRKQIAEDLKGKVIASAEFMPYEDLGDDEYWVINFEDGTEMSFRFMAELT